MSKIPPMPKYGEPANTPEDTFRILKRLPFDRMLEIVTNYYKNTGPGASRNDVEIILSFHGWRMDEYEKSMMAYHLSKKK